MAKKSAAARQANAARRLQAATRDQGVKLVRAPGAPGAARGGLTDPALATTPRSRTAAPSAPPSTPATSGSATPRSAGSIGAAAASRPANVPRPSATKTAPPAMPQRTAPIVPTSAAGATAPSATRLPAGRTPARSSRAAPRGRPSAPVVAEQYAYVRGDLRLIGILVTIMFLIIIGLYFYLRSLGQV